MSRLLLPSRSTRSRECSTTCRSHGCNLSWSVRDGMWNVRSCWHVSLSSRGIARDRKISNMTWLGGLKCLSMHSSKKGCGIHNRMMASQMRILCHHSHHKLMFHLRVWSALPTEEKHSKSICKNLEVVIFCSSRHPQHSLCPQSSPLD